MKFSIDGIFAGWNTSVAGKRVIFDANGCGCCGALQLQRKISRSGSRINYALEITNISDVPVNLPDIAVLDVGQPEFDVPFADMKVFKLARQKNDVPGVFMPARRDDDAYLDAIHIMILSIPKANLDTMHIM